MKKVITISTFILLLSIAGIAQTATQQPSESTIVYTFNPNDVTNLVKRTSHGTSRIWYIYGIKKEEKIAKEVSRIKTSALKSGVQVLYIKEAKQGWFITKVSAVGYVQTGAQQAKESTIIYTFNPNDIESMSLRTEHKSRQWALFGNRDEMITKIANEVKASAVKNDVRVIYIEEIKRGWFLAKMVKVSVKGYAHN